LTQLETLSNLSSGKGKDDESVGERRDGYIREEKERQKKSKEEE